MPELDAEELFHLALKASEKGDNDKAIVYLKESINLQPRAESFYILGAEYAEIGMYKRAGEYMEKALSLKPELHTARFQCGLLFMLQDLRNEAINIWLPLCELPKEDPLYQFATGLSYLIANDKERALDALEKGISLNNTNLALNRDMQNVINRLKSETATGIQQSPVTDTDKNDIVEDTAHKAMLIKNYGQES